MHNCQYIAEPSAAGLCKQPLPKRDGLCGGSPQRLQHLPLGYRCHHGASAHLHQSGNLPKARRESPWDAAPSALVTEHCCQEGRGADNDRSATRKPYSHHDIHPFLTKSHLGPTHKAPGARRQQGSRRPSRAASRSQRIPSHYTGSETNRASHRRHCLHRQRRAPAAAHLPTPPAGGRGPAARPRTAPDTPVPAAPPYRRRAARAAASLGPFAREAAASTATHRLSGQRRPLRRDTAPSRTSCGRFRPRLLRLATPLPPGRHGAGDGVRWRRGGGGGGGGEGDKQPGSARPPSLAAES